MTPSFRSNQLSVIKENQDMSAISAFRPSMQNVSSGTILSVILSLLLTACQASTSESPHPITTAPTGAVAADKKVSIPASDAMSAQSGDSDLLPQRADASYQRATLRPQYAECVDATGGVTPELQACIDEELTWQQRRLEEAFGKVVDGPDGVDKDRLMDEQAAYMADTTRHCSARPGEDGQGQLLDAQSCRLNRTANRADALQAVVSR
jgi:uncharacterized protein YecT (DUF1311 family)